MALRLLCAALVAWRAGAAARGQEPASSIEVVLASTLDHNPDVRTARAVVDAQRGALVQSRDPFDLRPTVSLTNSRTMLNDDSGPAEGFAPYATFGTTSAIGAAKLFRSGVEVTSDIAMVRTSPLSPNGPTFNEFETTTSLRVPLSRGRGGGLATASERAAREDLTAADRAYRATAAEAVLRATLAFWDYRAAYARAAIQDEAAKRSQQSVNELEILIRADERPRSDIDLMLANAAAKRASAMQANRQIVQARTELALAMGVDARDGAALPQPSTEFPAADDALPPPFEPMLAETLARHDELAAARARRQRAGLIRDATGRELRPRVDVLFTTGYTGQVGGRSVGRLFESLYRNVLGPNTAVQILFEPSIANSFERGAILQAEADYTRASIAADTLSRTIALTLTDALAGFTASRAQLETTREAVERSRLALATVHRNFELGTATIFDRILAEDTVTNSELSRLAAQRDYAAAIAQLQFARGVLVEMRGGALAADARRVMTVSPEEGR